MRLTVPAETIGQNDLFPQRGPVGNGAAVFATVLVSPCAADQLDGRSKIWQASCEALRSRQLLAPQAADVMEDIAEMIHDVQVEATFPDRTTLITVHKPIR